MADVIINIYTPDGKKVGNFVNPKIEMLPTHHYFLSGKFFEADGSMADKIEFNPQVLPYIADISAISKCGHEKLTGIYVQRARQPIQMTGYCKSA